MSSTGGEDRRVAVSADERALESVPLVHAVVAEVAARVPATVERDELLSAGLVALVEAAREFEARYDGAFEVYATARIKVALLEVLRATGSGPPRPTPAEAGGLSGDQSGDGPAAGEPREHRLVALRDAIEELSERHRMVISGYFLEEQDETEIAADLGVAEAALVQLRTEALMELRDALRPPGAESGAAAADSEALRRTAHAAALSRRALLRVSGTPDVHTVPRGA